MTNFELAAAGLRLDDAIGAFDEEVARQPANEESFGRAEADFLTAQAVYRAVLRDATGSEPDDILRRLSR